MTLKDFKSPKHKIFAMLMTGRDKWREKHHAVKQSLKGANNQLRAVTKSRDQWRKRALKAEHQLRSAQETLKKKTQK